MAEIDTETDTFETMVAGLVRHIFGAGEEGIKARLRESKADLPNAVGTLSFTMVNEAVEQATKAGREVDLDMTMGVATEVIDSLLQIAEAMGLIADAENEELKEDCMMHAVQAYIMTSEPTGEEMEAAQQLLAQMQQDGSYDEGVATLSEMGARRGIDPFADDAPVPDDGVDAAAVDAARRGGQPAQQPGQPRPLIGA